MKCAINRNKLWNGFSIRFSFPDHSSLRGRGGKRRGGKGKKGEGRKAEGREELH